MAAVKKLTDLFPCPDPDKNPLTHSLDDLAFPLDDSFLWLPNRPCLGRWGDWQDDIDLVDNVVYRPGAISIGGLIKSQLGSGGGAKQHHGRPPDSQSVPDKVQP